MKKIWKIFLTIILAIIIIALFLLGSFKKIATLLQSHNLSFEVGDIQFSAYLILKVIIAFIVIYWVTNFVNSFGAKRIKSIKRIDASNRELLLKIFQTFVYIVAFLTGLNILGINLTALTVFSGAFGIGIGFGLQKITSNFISGIILLMEKSIKIGDLIELNDGTLGYIRHNSSRYTLIESADGKEVIIPNEEFIINKVTNWTYSNLQGRAEIKVSVSYDSDLKKAQSLILEAANECEASAKDPAATCHLTNLGESSVEFILYFWVRNINDGRLDPKSKIMFSILEKFAKYNIVIPYPQREIYIKNSPTKEINNSIKSKI